MSKRFIDGTDLTNMIFSGSKILQSQVSWINSLNVFPVPDGDTGTNMNMTFSSGIEMIKNNPNQDLGKTAALFAKGVLMGARGNSGVILSQLIGGFAKSVAGKHEIDGAQFADALQQGVNAAYQAVVKPVEGTILTVSREAAHEGVRIAHNHSEISDIMKGVLAKAKESLSKTPDLLPVLKQAKVVDSGGQGLVMIYEGFCAALENKDAADIVSEINKGESLLLSHHLVPDKAPEHPNAQASFKTDEIIYPYDMEFFIHLIPEKEPFELHAFRNVLEKDGDSVLVILDEEVVKVHVHTKEPGNVLNEAIRFGELRKFHIENMRDQHRSILDDLPKEKPSKASGVVAVAVGEGIKDILLSLGVNYVLAGGQTMNPSTEDIVEAIRKVDAETIYVFPNNSNIIMAAKQAVQLSDKDVVVIPTVSIPECIAAMLSFNEEANQKDNETAMNEASKHVKSGLVTYAVRNSQYDDVMISEGDFLGIYNSRIKVSNEDLLMTSKTLLREMVSDGDEILSIFHGIDTTKETSDELITFMKEAYPELEIESHYGGQPLYHFIFSVE